MKTDSVRVLVTGAGSGVGQGIIKSLRSSKLPLFIVSADISPLNASLYVSDDSVIIPKVESDDSITSIVRIIIEKKIDVVMVGSEFDLLFFAENKDRIQNATGSIVIVSDSNLVNIADDKLQTAEFLRKNNLPYSESFYDKDFNKVSSISNKWGFPVVLKSRTGTSSRHVYIIESKKDLEKKWYKTPNPMIQKIVAMPSSELNKEYTCSVFKTLSGNILGPFCARRTLRSGTSWHIEVDSFPEINSVLLEIARKIDFQGSLNIQLMVGDNGPIPFEINARFSGTTAVRAHFGFNEPKMAIESFYYGIEPDKPIIKKGIAMRYHEEVFINDTDASKLNVGMKGVVNRWF